LLVGLRQKLVIFFDEKKIDFLKKEKEMYIKKKQGG
jgi:hypothetical protein